LASQPTACGCLRLLPCEVWSAHADTCPAPVLASSSRFGSLFAWKDVQGNSTQLPYRCFCFTFTPRSLWHSGDIYVDKNRLNMLYSGYPSERRRSCPCILRLRKVWSENMHLSLFKILHAISLSHGGNPTHLFRLPWDCLRCRGKARRRQLSQLHPCPYDLYNRAKRKT